MYDRDTEHVFAMMLRMEWPEEQMPLAELKTDLAEIGRAKQLEIRAWARTQRSGPARLAICTTYRPEPALAVLRAIRDGRLRAEPALMLGNRPHCRGVAEQFSIAWRQIGDAKGSPDNERMVQLLDEYDIDFVVLARYMRLIPASTCWRFAGGRIINLHHGLLPSFPGPRPYADAFSHRMLTFGATAHFIVPELDAGNQIIHQSAFTVFPGTPLQDIKRQGQQDNEPECLVEGLRRVVTGEVALHFHRVVTGA